MKKLMKNFALAGLIVLGTAAAAHAAGQYGDPCVLVTQLQGVFKTLRTLAFVGAAFFIAGWAWGYISKPEDAKMENLKIKGTGLIVGFALLFGIGIVLQFLPGIAGCAAVGW